MNTLFRSIVLPAKDFLFPPLCFSCNARLTDAESRICNSCWQSMEHIHSDDETVQLLRRRFASEGFIDEFYSCYYFQEKGAFQQLVHSLKYNGMTQFGIELGGNIGMTLKDNIDTRSIDGIIPIPLHPLKQRERGYNQSEFICKGISASILRPVRPSLVKRSKNTISQTHLTAEERGKNVGDAFEINSAEEYSVKGKTLLIVDDVITTGSTIQSLAKLLKKSGAAKIIAASAALAKLGKEE